MEVNFKETKMPLPNIENCGEYKDKGIRLSKYVVVQ